MEHLADTEGMEVAHAVYESVDVEICVVRFKNQTADIVLTMNGRSSSPDAPRVTDVVKTLKVNEWGLFGES